MSKPPRFAYSVELRASMEAAPRIREGKDPGLQICMHITSNLSTFKLRVVRQYTGDEIVSGDGKARGHGQRKGLPKVHRHAIGIVLDGRCTQKSWIAQLNTRLIKPCSV